MPTSDRVDDVFREAAGAIHPRDGSLNVLRNRVAALERQVAYLARRVDVLVDLLNSDDE